MSAPPTPRNPILFDFYFVAGYATYSEQGFSSFAEVGMQVYETAAKVQVFFSKELPQSAPDQVHRYVEASKESNFRLYDKKMKCFPSIPQGASFAACLMRPKVLCRFPEKTLYFRKPFGFFRVKELSFECRTIKPIPDVEKKILLALVKKVVAGFCLAVFQENITVQEITSREH